MRGTCGPLILSDCLLGLARLRGAYQRKRIASCKMRGVTSDAGFPIPRKFVVLGFRSLSARPDKKVFNVRGCPFRPRYRPVKGFRHAAVQLKLGFATPPAVSAGSCSALRTSFESLAINITWLKTLNTSSLSSTLAVSHLGMRIDFISE